MADPLPIDNNSNYVAPVEQNNIVEPQQVVPPSPGLYDEFAGVDEAIRQQEQIAINTSGLPVLAEDGSVAQGIKINPETGEVYSTEPTPSEQGGPEPESQSAGTTQARNSGGTSTGAGSEAPPDTDFRVRLSLAPSANYLYKDPAAQSDPNNILRPLVETDGVLFPYTPQINVTYSANYTNTDLTHTNYKIYNYVNSAVENISIIADFTAQDTFEANYVLAVIHFLRSATKMFYGRDSDPIKGIPPPLVYLKGYGTYGFANHQMVITNFTLNLPNDVDYINAKPNISGGAYSLNEYKAPRTVSTNVFERIKNGNKGGDFRGLLPGGYPSPPNFGTGPSSNVSTRVPTKLQIQLQCLPIVTRYNISNNFSLKDYASGKLLKQGIW